MVRIGFSLEFPLSLPPSLPPSETWCLWSGAAAVSSLPLVRSTPPLVLSPHWILGFHPRCAWGHVSNTIASRPSLSLLSHDSLKAKSVSLES